MARTWDEVKHRWHQFRDMRPRRAPAAEAVRLRLIGWIVPVCARGGSDTETVTADEAWAQCDLAATAMHTGDAAVWDAPRAPVAVAVPSMTGPVPAKRARKPRKKAAKKAE